jgi:prepilin-type N-terminal cleavage/methylation domain-containing protein
MSRKGFTLLELMVVVTIIALLAALAMPQISEINRRARGARSSANLKQLQTSMDEWELEYGAPLDPTIGDRATGDTGNILIDPTSCNTAFSQQNGTGGGDPSSNFAIAVGRYTKVNNTLWNSPQSPNNNSSTYYYRVFATTDNSDGTPVTVLSSAVWSVFNGQSLWEPRLSKQQVNSGQAQILFVNNYEDMGRLGPDGELLGGGAGGITPASSTGN